MVTWGTSPQDVVSITGSVPDPEKEKNEDKKAAMNRSLNYMGLKPNVKVTDIKIDKEGSTTTSATVLYDLLRKLPSNLDVTFDLENQKTTENIDSFYISYKSEILLDNKDKDYFTKQCLKEFGHDY